MLSSRAHTPLSDAVCTVLRFLEQEIHMNLISVGEMVIDFLPGEENGVYIRKAGGAPANVAVAVARNGLEAGFCGCMGNDDFGIFLAKTLEENNVRNLCPPLLDEAITTMAFVTLNSDGDRSFTFARKPGADIFLTRDAVDMANIEAADMIHAGSCSLSKNPAADATVYALAEAKRHDKLVSFDVNYRNLMWNDDRGACAEAVQKLLHLVDFLKISEEEEDMLGMPLDKATQHYDITLAVETLGAKGAVCLYRGQRIIVPGLRAQCVDATGAGDAFWGGFISCLLREGIKKTADISVEVVKKAMSYGNVAGWLCVQKKGAMESLPYTEDIERILRETI